MGIAGLLYFIVLCITQLTVFLSKVATDPFIVVSSNHSSSNVDENLSTLLALYHSLKGLHCFLFAFLYNTWFAALMSMKLLKIPDASRVFYEVVVACVLAEAVTVG